VTEYTSLIAIDQDGDNQVQRTMKLQKIDTIDNDEERGMQRPSRGRGGRKMNKGKVGKEKKKEK